jgi:predicted DCC family thiol-disulfide oxidoreductase YuxK
MCLRWVGRFRAPLEKHGFILLPLQSDAVRALLHMGEPELLREMRVITREGIIYGGADALIFISRAIWKPLFYLSAIPGVKPLLRHAYRVVADNRHCGDGACQTKGETK